MELWSQQGGINCAPEALHTHWTQPACACCADIDKLLGTTLIRIYTILTVWYILMLEGDNDILTLTAMVFDSLVYFFDSWIHFLTIGYIFWHFDIFFWQFDIFFDSWIYFLTVWYIFFDMLIYILYPGKVGQLGWIMYQLWLHSHNLVTTIHKTKMTFL